MEKIQSEKMTGTSMDISAENRFRLKQLFPSVFTETKNALGELVESIDFEKLKAELGTFSDLFESRRERYGMDWPGKKEALRLVQTPSAATLKPCREESVNFDTTENLYIEGDNLEVLKLLQKSYYGKVKMIYIDPPYNTGKEFIYPDNYTESLETYLEYAGLIDGDGKKFSTNTANEGRFHTKWLNMMYPRLYLARNLLRDDGVIFISIDDNEVSNLRKMCDEIFGEENALPVIIRRSKIGGGSDNKQFAKEADYIISYAKDVIQLNKFFVPHTDDDLKRYSQLDEKGRFFWDTYSRSGLLIGDAESDSLHYEVLFPDGTKRSDRWRRSKERLAQDIKENEAKFIKTSKGWNIHFKQRLNDEGKRPRQIIYENMGNTLGKDELQELELSDYFDYPKPVTLAKYLSQVSITSDALILDFFSGSATTAHAILDLNKHDSGNRKFIMVQLPEPCSEDSEAFKAGYKNIAEIGKERIRRVIKKLNSGDAEKKENKQGTIFDKEEEPVLQDRGFKVLKLDKSNFRQWQSLDPSTPQEQIVEQLELHKDHIGQKSTQEDLLYEILLKAGFTPTEKIEKKTIAGKTVYSVAEGALLLCLEDVVTKELIDKMAEMEPMQFICLDSAFHGNDQLKANAVQTFAARNMEKEKHNQIIFKTV